MKISATNLFNLSHSMAGEYIARFQYPWQALEGLKDFIINLGQSLSPEEYDQLSRMSGYIKRQSSHPQPVWVRPA